MSQPTLGFIGGGRIARILLGGWHRAGVKFSQVVVCEPAEAAWAALEATVPDAPLIRGEASQAATQSVVFLAVHPPQLPEVAETIMNSVNVDTIVVSVAPKFTLAKLHGMLGGTTQLVRIIPNAPSLFGRGFNPMTCSAKLDDAGRRTIHALLKPLGELPEVAEETLEGYAILTAMGPTYFWPQWLELESLAPAFGLEPHDARLALQAMTIGAFEMLTSSQLTPEQIVDLIPVKPLADYEPELRAAYRSRLTALFDKIHP